MNGQTASTRNRAPIEPANDNIPGIITPDDTSFLLTLGAICVAIVGLAAYVALSAPNDVMAMLRK